MKVGRLLLQMQDTYCIQRWIRHRLLMEEPLRAPEKCWLKQVLRSWNTMFIASKLYTTNHTMSTSKPYITAVQVSSLEAFENI